MREFHPDIVGQDLKEEYDWTCAKCGHKLSARPSMFMRMGFNMGGGSCPECKSWNHLSIDDKNVGMNATLELVEEDINAQTH